MAFTSRFNPPGNHRRVVALACRAQPGEWFDLASGLTSDQAYGRAWRVHNEPGKTFQPAGAYEARKDRCDDGSYMVRVRYVDACSTTAVPENQPDA